MPRAWHLDLVLDFHRLVTYEVLHHLRAVVEIYSAFYFSRVVQCFFRGFIVLQPSTEAFPMEVSGVSCRASASGSATAMRVTSLMVAGNSFCVPYHWVESGIIPLKINMSPEKGPF